MGDPTSYLLVIVVVAVLFWAFRGRSGKENQSFREYITGPDGIASAKRFRDRQNVTIPDNVDDSMIEDWVRQLLNPVDENFALERLKLTGQQAVPALLRALENPVYANTKLAEFSTPTALHRVSHILQAIKPSDAVGVATSLIEREDKEIRKEVALLLGSIATTGCIPGVLKALEDEDGFVRSYARMGIERAIEGGAGERAFFDAVFEPVVRLFDSDQHGFHRTARCLMSLDSERAIKMMLDKRFFKPDNKALAGILKALNESQVSIPKEWLNPLIDEYRDKCNEPPISFCLGQVLIALAQTKDRNAEGVIRSFIDSEESRVRDDASLALCVFHGLADPLEVVFGLEREVGFDKLTKAQKYVSCVYGLKGEVENGGLSQYFFNSTGDYVSIAMEALKAINAPHTATLMQQAIDIFGKDGPSSDRQKRIKQLSRMKSKQDDEFGRLDKTFYEDNDHLVVQLNLYAIEHQEDFRSNLLHN